LLDGRLATSATLLSLEVLADSVDMAAILSLEDILLPHLLVDMVAAVRTPLGKGIGFVHSGLLLFLDGARLLHLHHFSGNNNFARRTSCHRCNAPRQDGAPPVTPAYPPPPAYGYPPSQPAYGVPPPQPAYGGGFQYREGDWTCTSWSVALRGTPDHYHMMPMAFISNVDLPWLCSGNSNFARRTNCHRCNAARPAQ